MKITVLGLSVTSSWGNGHATTFRSLLKAFHKRGHEITFLERDVPYYAQNRDMPRPSFCKVKYYNNLDELKNLHINDIKHTDAVMVGSYVPEGTQVNELVFASANGVKMFYDIDTPVTMAKISKGDYQYISPQQIQHFDLYLSFSGGPILDYIMENYNSPRAVPLYCSVDPDLYFPSLTRAKWQMGYLGTYSIDRQPTVEKLLNRTALLSPEMDFVVAGPQYPQNYLWSKNVEWIPHLPPAQHRQFYCSQHYTLNVTRKDMIKAGYSPSVRLFEAAACGVPIISDYWKGLDNFFDIGSEILVAQTTEDVLNHWLNISESERMAIGEKARQKVLKNHTSRIRAKQLENFIVSFEEIPTTQEYEKH